MPLSYENRTTALFYPDAEAGQYNLRPFFGRAFLAQFANQQYIIDGKLVTFDAALDITRASSKYVWQPVNAQMQLVEIPAGEPAFAYDPVTGKALGLSVEGSATNLLTNTVFDGAASDPSRSAPTGYSFIISGGSFEVLSSSVLDGKNVLRFTVSNARDFIEQTVAVSSSTTYKYWARVNVVDDLIVNNIILNVLGGTQQYSVDGIDVANNYTVPAGVHLIGLEITTGGSQTSIGLRLGAGCAGNDTGSAEIDLLQFEAGTKPTSYIPTTTSTATRDADSVTSDSATFGDWFSSSEGTFVVEFDVFYPAASTPRILVLSDGTTSNRIDLSVNNLSGLVTITHAKNGTFENLNNVSVSPGVKTVVGFTYDSSSLSLYTKNAPEVATDNSANIPTSVTMANLGSHPVFGGKLNGNMRLVSFKPEKITEQQLKDKVNGA